ncbi:MAG: ribonuclease H-like domain-containing protein [Candidatus Liptonbacteria bacterium]|nr:ribonuclease H-like domain-containing protein [Candidatus Liptonbacteria bacterium]
MSKLVLDIETVGVDFDLLDETSRKQLETYFARVSKDDAEAEERKDKLGFWPLTGEVIVIGCFNPDTKKGVVFANNSGSNDNKNKQKMQEALGDEIQIELGGEKEILGKFWEVAKKYNTFITFNGRGMDAPFLMIRSAIHGIRPSKNLLKNRYNSYQDYDAMHVDLQDQLTFYGAMRKPFSLHFWTRAFGITSPKEEGVSGDDVKRLYSEGKIKEIVEYNIRDIKATAELYEKWEKYLSF